MRELKIFGVISELPFILLHDVNLLEANLSCQLLNILCVHQGWKLKPKPKPENPVLKEILETQTETDTYLSKILKTWTWTETVFSWIVKTETEFFLRF